MFTTNTSYAVAPTDRRCKSEATLSPQSLKSRLRCSTTSKSADLTQVSKPSGRPPVRGVTNVWYPAAAILFSYSALVSAFACQNSWRQHTDEDWSRRASTTRVCRAVATSGRVASMTTVPSSCLTRR